jgi:uncharacterized protein YecT (DUF1311 family)
MKKIIILISITFFCNNINAQTQLELNQNAAKKYQKSDAKLNQIYNQLMKISEPSEKKLLVQAQKNWLKFRDAHCNFEISAYQGGSIQPLIYSDCLTECTETRIKQLKNALKEKNNTN